MRISPATRDATLLESIRDDEHIRIIRSAVRHSSTDSQLHARLSSAFTPPMKVPVQSAVEIIRCFFGKKLLAAAGINSCVTITN